MRRPIPGRTVGGNRIDHAVGQAVKQQARVVADLLGNRMIDLMPTNEKLRIRSRRMLRELAGVGDDEAGALLRAAGGRLKPALVAALAGVDPERAASLLEEHGGHVGAAVRAASGANGS